MYQSRTSARLATQSSVAAVPPREMGPGVLQALAYRMLAYDCFSSVKRICRRGPQKLILMLEKSHSGYLIGVGGVKQT